MSEFQALVEKFRAAGAERPGEWAASEVEEDIPQLARFLFLRSVWRSAEQWKQPPAEWFAEVEPAPADEEPAEEDDDEPTLVPSSPDEVADVDADPPSLPRSRRCGASWPRARTRKT